MKTLSQKLFEAKFSNFNNTELKAFQDELDSLKKNVDFIKKVIDSRKAPVPGIGGGKWYKSRNVTKSDKIEYGKKYLLVFDNPFANGKQLTTKYSEEYENTHPACSPNEDKVVICIGVADKFSKLHLVNQWEKGCTVEKTEKGLFLQDKQDKMNKFYSPAGWYLKRNGFSCYYVYQDDDFYIVYPEKQANTKVRLENCTVLDISMLPEQFEKIQKDIEARAEYDAKVAERIRKQNEADAKQKKDAEDFEKEFKDYKDFGCMNGWDKVPAEIDKAMKDPDAQWVVDKLGHAYRQYYSKKYKVTYSVDSSD